MLLLVHIATNVVRMDGGSRFGDLPDLGFSRFRRLNSCQWKSLKRPVLESFSPRNTFFSREKLSFSAHIHTS